MSANMGTRLLVAAAATACQQRARARAPEMHPAIALLNRCVPLPVHSGYDLKIHGVAHLDRPGLIAPSRLGELRARTAAARNAATLSYTVRATAVGVILLQSPLLSARRWDDGRVLRRRWKLFARVCVAVQGGVEHLRGPVFSRYVSRRLWDREVESVVSLPWSEEVGKEGGRGVEVNEGMLTTKRPGNDYVSGNDTIVGPKESHTRTTQHTPTPGQLANWAALYTLQTPLGLPAADLEAMHVSSSRQSGPSDTSTRAPSNVSSPSNEQKNRLIGGQASRQCLNAKEGAEGGRRGGNGPGPPGRKGAAIL